MTNRSLRFGLLLALPTAAMSASAAPLAYTLSGNAELILDGNFGRKDFVLTFTGDTANIVHSGDFYSLVANGVQVTVEGVTDTITVPLALSLYTGAPDYDAGNYGPSVGFSSDDGHLAVSLLDSSLETYDLATALGPLTGPGQSGIDTTGVPTLNGNFALIRPATVAFTAAPVPEPASLVALGLGGLAFLRRRKRA